MAIRGLWVRDCPESTGLRSTLAKFHYPTRTSFASMTNEDGYIIQSGLSELGFPFIFDKSVQFALFRTYGIPTILKLLVQTSQFSEECTATKRYADTALLIAESMGSHPTSTRSIEAIGRMNYIHSQYQKAGKILDDDLLYPGSGRWRAQSLDRQVRMAEIRGHRKVCNLHFLEGHRGRHGDQF